jgi:serine/threonine-protein kinase
VGYFLLTGKPIFEGDNSLEITNQIMHAPAPRASASGVAGIPEALDALVATCLEKDRARRPQSAEAVIEALDRLASRLAWTQPDADAWWSAYRESRKAAAASTEAAPA